MEGGTEGGTEGWKGGQTSLTGLMMHVEVGHDVQLRVQGPPVPRYSLQVQTKLDESCHAQFINRPGFEVNSDGIEPS